MKPTNKFEIILKRHFNKKNSISCSSVSDNILFHSKAKKKKKRNEKWCNTISTFRKFWKIERFENKLNFFSLLVYLLFFVSLYFRFNYHHQFIFYRWALNWLVQLLTELKIIKMVKGIFFIENCIVGKGFFW